MQQRCPNCGAPVVPGQRFCGGCGAQLSLSCPQCRITVSPGTRFCPNCGTTLGGSMPQQPGWGQQPGGMPPQQPGWGQQLGLGQQQSWAPPAPKSQSSSSRPLLVLLLFILLIGLGVLAYFKTPLGSTINSILGISGTTTDTNNNTAADTTLPVISSIVQPTSPDTLGPTSASILWKTDELSSSQVEYGTSEAYGTLKPTPPDTDPTVRGTDGKSLSAGVIDHSVVLTGLQPNTTYNYRVKSKDAAGNEAISQDKTFTTISPD